MKYILFSMSLFLLGFNSCSKETDLKECEHPVQEISSLVFGHYYGECIGEDCIQIYKLSGGHLYEDTLDSYAGNGPQAYVLRSQEDFQLVQDLMDYYPQELLSLSDTTYGCPDCADQGGIFIQLSKEGVLLSFNIDQDMVAVPPYLHSFMVKVNEYIALISD